MGGEPSCPPPTPVCPVGVTSAPNPIAVAPLPQSGLCWVGLEPAGGAGRALGAAHLLELSLPALPQLCCPASAGSAPPLLSFSFLFPAAKFSQWLSALGTWAPGKRSAAALQSMEVCSMTLRPYQWEVIMPALEGKNIIIWLPTGAGKTRAAAYVAKKHLATVDRAKVVVLVNRVHLVTQHHEEFSRMLDKRWSIATLSGDMGPRPGFGHLTRKNDLLICTAELLQMALSSQEQEEHVELNDFSLLVVDECHHTHKGTVYNVILSRYLEQKLCGAKRLPQVLGLTASPGTGGANTLKGAIEHILQLCANLDTQLIMSPQKSLPELQEHNHQPCKKYDLCHGRSEDPFGDMLKNLMDQIHDHMEMPELSRDFGTQAYEQKVVELMRDAAQAGLLERRVFALHLRHYNDALLIHETVRAVDALAVLQDFYDRERTTKTWVLHAERWLMELFKEHRRELTRLAQCGPENPKLEMLEQILQEQFGSQGRPQGLIFTRTRQSAHSLLLWLQQQPGLQTVDIRAELLIGAGSGSSQNTHMTQKGQQEVIQKFRQGSLNLLVATSVAEEGLDIPQCNVVVRYGLLTNEISMVQARGRARANQSLYTFVATKNSRELRREQTNEVLEALMEQAVATVQKMDSAKFQAKLRELQCSALVHRAAQAAQRERQQQQFLAEEVQLLCINCMVAVGHGSDLRKVEGAHHVNVNANFSIYYNVSQQPVAIEKVFKDWTPGGVISCRNCGELWGLQMIYKSVKLPALKVRSMLLQTPQGRIQAKKWSRVPFPVPDFNYLQHCAQSLSLD